MSVTAAGPVLIPEEPRHSKAIRDTEKESAGIMPDAGVHTKQKAAPVTDASTEDERSANRQRFAVSHSKLNPQSHQLLLDPLAC